MCGTTAQPEKEGWKRWSRVKDLAGGVNGQLLGDLAKAAGIIAVVWGLHDEYKKSEWGLYYALRKIVTAKYIPDNSATPMKDYVTRHQETKLAQDLHKYLNNARGGFFMLVGESGSGRTTLMQTLLQKEYKEGVLELSLSAEDMIKRNAEGKPFVDQLDESVRNLFHNCADHPKRRKNITDFVGHADKIRRETKGKDAHPLIIYITLESKEALEYDTMMEFSGAFGSLGTLLSSKTHSCKTIVELSHTAMSDDIKKMRISDQADFEVNAMTEDEFLKIGKQVLKVSKDEQNLVDEYLKYYHDWLGGHTRTLTDLATEAQPASMHTLCCLCTMLMNHPSFVGVVS